MASPDTANWVGIEMISRRVTKARKCGNRYYANDYEVMFDTLLSEHGVPFTPHVRIPVRHHRGSEHPCHPDFIFNKYRCRWTCPHTGTVEIAHGIELKSRPRSPRDVQRFDQIEADRGIRIIIVTNDTVEQLFLTKTLPLVLVDGPTP